MSRQEVTALLELKINELEIFITILQTAITTDLVTKPICTLGTVIRDIVIDFSLIEKHRSARQRLMYAAACSILAAKSKIGIYRYS